MAILKSKLKAISFFLLALLLIYIGFNYFLTKEQRKLFFSVSLLNHLISILLALPVYFIGGIQLKQLYNKISGIKLSAYDTLTLPFAVNLWGFIIPQGSFFYTMTYISLKYKKRIADSIKIYIVSFSIAMSLAGLAGMMYFVFSSFNLSKLFFIGCSLLFINPLIIYFIGTIAETHKNIKYRWIASILEKTNMVIHSKFEKTLLLKIVLINLAAVSMNSLWGLWIASIFNIPLSFIQIMLITFLMNLTALFKITPGNIGINQFASGGVAVLVGGTLNDGFLLSSFQYLTTIITAATFGSLITILNHKHFNWDALKTMLAKKEKETKEEPAHK